MSCDLTAGTSTVGETPFPWFAVTTAIAVIVGAAGLRHHARRAGLSKVEIGVLGGMCLAGGFLSAHVFDVVFYHPQRLSSGVGALIDLTQGLSSIGGLVGGFLASRWFSHLTRRPWLPILDTLTYAVVPALAIGRVGCFLVHDHPGVPTSSPLGVAFPDGIRHDLGLEEALLLGVIWVALWWWARRPRRLGVESDAGTELNHPRTVGGAWRLFALTYGVGRFLLDWLRESPAAAPASLHAAGIDALDLDPRWLGLTAAQWVCLAVTGVVAAGLVRRARPPGPQPPGRCRH